MKKATHTTSVPLYSGRGYDVQSVHQTSIIISLSARCDIRRRVLSPLRIHSLSRQVGQHLGDGIETQLPHQQILLVKMELL